jgi:hypothetical protein
MSSHAERGRILQALNVLAQAKGEWDRRYQEFADTHRELERTTIQTGMLNYIPHKEIASALGITPGQLSALMSRYKLRGPKKHTIDRSPDRVRRANAAKLGVDVSLVPLLSPLAYLPVGERLIEEVVALQVPNQDTKEKDE